MPRHCGRLKTCLGGTGWTRPGWQHIAIVDVIDIVIVVVVIGIVIRLVRF